MQYMKALFVSEEPDQDVPEKMADLMDKYEKKTSRASRIIGLTGPDVNAVSLSFAAAKISSWTRHGCALLFVTIHTQVPG